MRYLPLTDTDRRTMLASVGVGSIDDLFADVPAEARGTAPPDLPDHAPEFEVERAFRRMADRNLSPGQSPFFLGAGLYRHHVPASVDYLIQRGEFLTAYTPYQPEVSQGTLQALFEFQTQVALMTGMEVANASMYDGATGCAEAALMAVRITKRDKVLLSGGLHPHYREVTETQLRFHDLEQEHLAPDPFGTEDLAGRVDGETACVIVQTPDFFGRLRDLRALASTCRDHGALLVAVVTEPVSMGLIEPPGHMGADIVVADGQSIGNGMSFGGPGLGLFACRDKHKRQMPGRLAGETVDEDGKRGWVLTLSTREQHIRREKATSNICTNSGLCALAFTIHMTLLGETGFTDLARLNHAKAVQLAGKLSGIKGVKVMPEAFFNEFAIELPGDAVEVSRRLADDHGILGGVPVSRFYPEWEELKPVMLVAATELTTEDEMDALAESLKEVLA